MDALQEQDQGEIEKERIRYISVQEVDRNSYFLSLQGIEEDGGMLVSISIFGDSEEVEVSFTQPFHLSILRGQCISIDYLVDCEFHLKNNPLQVVFERMLAKQAQLEIERLDEITIRFTLKIGSFTSSTQRDARELVNHLSVE